MFQNSKAPVLSRRYTEWEEAPLHLFISGLGAVECSPPLPAHFSSRKESRYSQNMGLSGPKKHSGRFDELKNFFPVSGFEPQTIQRVAWSLHSLCHSDHSVCRRNISITKNYFLKTCSLQNDLDHPIAKTLSPAEGWRVGGCPLLWLFNLLIKTIKKSLCCMAEEPITVLPMQTLWGRVFGTKVA